MKKIIIVFFAFLLSLNLNSQDRSSEIFFSLVKTPESFSYVDYINTGNVEKMKFNSYEYKNISELISSLPSILIRETSSNLGSSFASIRGFSSNQTVIVFNDVKLPKDITSTYDLNILPPVVFSDIYILKGGWSSVFGSNAEGGVIAIKTGKRLSQENRTEVYSEFGSYNSKRWILNNSVNKKNMESFVSAENYTSDGFQENSKVERNSFIYNLNHNFGKYGSTDINLFAVKLFRGLPSGTPVDISSFNGKNEKKANRKDDWQKDLNAFLSLSHSIKINENTLKLSYSRNNLLRKAYQYGSLTDINTYSNNILIKSSFRSYNLGFEFEQTYLKSNDYGNHKMENYGYFVSGNIEFNDKLNSGLYLRYDDNKNYENVLSPKLILNYQMNENTKFSYSVSKSWRSPSFADIYGSPAFWYDPNPDIKPEKNISNEFSFTYNNVKYSLNTDVYYYDVKDKISVYFDPFTLRFKSVNLSKGYTRGIETSVTYKIFNFNLYLGMNFMSVKGKNYGEGSYKKLAYNPDYKLNAGVKYNYNGYEVEFSANKTGNYYSGNNRTGKKIPSYTICNLNLKKEIRNMEFYFRINNIFNERYATTADTFNGYYPGLPRNISAGLKVYF